MCFVIVPQRRALFQHLNFQKCSGAEHVDFEICFAPQRRISTSESAPNMCVCVSLPHVLRAATACTFSTSQRPKALRA